ncbi:DUF397 domain-containing protein [Spirillospora sp. NPDC049652]
MSIQWRKSSYSHGSNSDCVELAVLPMGFGVRDSKAPSTGHLVLPRETLAFLLARVRQEDIAESTA